MATKPEKQFSTKEAGRPRGQPLDHHLVLRKGYWHFRWVREGRNRTVNTHIPESQRLAARKWRDEEMARIVLRSSGVDPLPAPISIDAAVKLYLAAESKPYDRVKGGIQPGCKRSSEAERTVVEYLKPVIDFSLPINRLDREHLLDAAAKMADLAPNTRRNRLAFLRRVYNWSRANKRKTGLTEDLFRDLDKGDRRRLFGGGTARRAPAYTPEQLLGLYAALPAQIAQPVRFCAHTGMRSGELVAMTWGRVDLATRTYTTDPRVTKMNRERIVPLSDIAAEILIRLRPPNPKPDDPVWLLPSGKPLRAIDCAMKRAMAKPEVAKLFPAPRPGWRLPDRHSLRRTTASAVAQVAPHAVVAAILGHSASDVTALYVTVPVVEQIKALNRAAKLIDGTNVVSISRRPKHIRAVMSPEMSRPARRDEAGAAK